MSLSGQVGLGEWGLPCMACSAPPAAAFLRAVGLMGLTCVVGCTPALQFGSGLRGELLGLSGWWPPAAPFSQKEPRGHHVTPPPGAVAAGASQDRARVHSFLGILTQQYQPEPAAWQDRAWCSLGGELGFLVLGTPTWTLGSSLRLGLWGEWVPGWGALPAQVRPGGSPHDPGNRANLGRVRGTGQCGTRAHTPQTSPGLSSQPCSVGGGGLLSPRGATIPG